MEEQVIIPIFGMLLTIIITLGVFVMIVYLRRYQNVERMSMIEKGVATDMFKRHRGGSTLRWSLMLIGVGIGFLMGYALDRMFDMEETGYFSMLFIFGGIGLGVSYMVEEKKGTGNGDIQ